MVGTLNCNMRPMSFPRSSGILLHPTSLPGGHGIGDLGPEAYRFVDFLVAAGQSYWQVLPLNPTGFGDSPYQTFSAFAGNHFLISLEALAHEGVIDEKSLPPPSSGLAVDFGAVYTGKTAALRQAFQSFQQRGPQWMKDNFHAFVTSPRSGWLADYALFRALKDKHEGGVWTGWEQDLVQRKPEALARAARDLQTEITFHKWLQFEFFRQWSGVRAYAAQYGVSMIGDAPIFVAHDSADVWANQGSFRLDGGGKPTHVAGVPPDYFSETGQLWGNPLYNWDALQSSGFHWWVERFRMLLTQVDYVRLDHFRGFEAFWEIPAGMPNAVVGKWVKAPGMHLLRALKKALGRLPIIAEDLGVITPEVELLRDSYDLPGMRILQFAFDEGPLSNHMPHNFVRNTVVYPGTHDNDTTLGWYATTSPSARDLLARYLGDRGEGVPWNIIRSGLASTADLSIQTAQDLLGLGSEARMNFPGKASGNWSWRLKPGALGDELARKLLDLNKCYARLQ
jgi:4-alpha-glucanotransferase